MAVFLEGALERSEHHVCAVRLAVGALLFGLFFTLVFAEFPRLDLIVASAFYSPESGFLGSTWLELFRTLFKALYEIGCIIALAGLATSLIRSTAYLGRPVHKWLYLVLCLAIGPGLVCNVVFKDEWGRARPRHVVEFNGDKQFTPPLAPAAECQRNCSFTCGEASSIYMLFFAFALFMRRRSNALIVAGVALGSAAGLVRMAAGGHFLSDVLFAGVTMALVAAALYFLFETFSVADESGKVSAAWIPRAVRN